MKKLIFLVLVFAGFMACENESIQELPQETSVTEDMNARMGDKIDVCHYDAENDSWYVINISTNAWEAHGKHGDVRLDDQDGDGYVPDNECGFGNQGDCDDLFAAINPGVEDDCEYIYKGSLTLTTQAEVDAFNYTQVTNWLTIQGESITNIDGLSSLTSVSGIIISDTSITNIDGLASLTSIGNLQIYRSPVANIDGLSGLDTIGLLNLTDTALTSIEGLRSWTRVNSLEIYNAPIANIDALSEFTFISFLDLRSLPNLTDVSNVFNNLDRADLIRISDCHGLTDIGGFDSLISLAYLYIEYNPNLLDISGFNQLTDLDDFALESVSMATITGFSSLSNIRYDLNISGTKLTAIPPIFSGTNSLGRFKIRNNSDLTDITAFQNINTVAYGIEITNNPNLEVCCAALPMLENSTSATINVSGNATGCNSVTEITNTCP